MFDSFGQGLYDKVSKHFAKVDPNYKTSLSRGGVTLHHVLGKTIYFTRSGPDKIAVINHHDGLGDEIVTSFAGLTRVLKENVA